MESVSTSLFRVLLLFIALAGCSKNNDDTKINFTIDAGEDVEIVLPEDSVRLNGVYKGQVEPYLVRWSQLAGPMEVIMENENSLNPKISPLYAGVYQFELVVISELKYKRDTVQVTVISPFEEDQEIGENEFIVENLVWDYDWYNTVEIPDFGMRVKNGELFKVFIKRGGSDEWIPVVPDKDYAPGILYTYAVHKLIGAQGPFYQGSLYIHYDGYDTDDSPSVKVIY